MNKLNKKCCNLPAVSLEDDAEVACKERKTVTFL